MLLFAPAKAKPDKRQRINSYFVLLRPDHGREVGRMMKRWVLLDDIIVYEYHPDGPRLVGTIGWDPD